MRCASTKTTFRFLETFHCFKCRYCCAVGFLCLIIHHTFLTQMRDRPGFCETRRQLLTLKPNNRNNWVTFAIANHMHSQNKTASEIIDAYMKTLEDGDSEVTANYENSEMALYKNQLIEETGDFDAAIAHLVECESYVKVRHLKALVQKKHTYTYTQTPTHPTCPHHSPSPQ